MATPAGPAPPTAAGRSAGAARWRLALPPLLAIAAFAATILIGLYVKPWPPALALDRNVFHLVNGLACGKSPDDPFYNAIWVALNRPSLNYFVLYGITTAYVLLFRRRLWLQLLVGFLVIASLGYVSNPVIWHWAWGPRPFTVTDACILHPEWEQAWSQYSSFPSGHARETASELTLMVTLWPASLLPALAYMALLAFSRLYIGVHLPSDVLTGAVLGWGIAQIALLCYRVYAAPLRGRMAARRRESVPADANTLDPPRSVDREVRPGT